MIDSLARIFREVFSMIKENAVAFYGAAVTFLAAFFIMISIRLGQRLEKSKDDQIQGNHPLAIENAALRKDRDAWRDTAMKVQMRYNNHLEADLRKADTSAH